MFLNNEKKKEKIEKKLLFLIYLSVKGKMREKKAKKSKSINKIK